MLFCFGFPNCLDKLMKLSRKSNRGILIPKEVIHEHLSQILIDLLIYLDINKQIQLFLILSI